MALVPLRTDCQRVSGFWPLGVMAPSPVMTTPWDAFTTAVPFRS